MRTHSTSFVDGHLLFKEPAISFAELQALERAAVESEVRKNELEFYERHVQPQIKEYMDNGAPETPFAYPLVPPPLKKAAQAAKSAARPEPNYAEMQRFGAKKTKDIAVNYVLQVSPSVQKTGIKGGAGSKSHTSKTPAQSVETNDLVEAVKGYQNQFSVALEKAKHTNPVTGEFTKTLGWGIAFGSEQNGDNFHITVPNQPSMREMVTKSSEIRENWGRIHGTWDADRKNPERVFGPESGSLEGRIAVDELKKEGQLERRLHIHALKH